LPCFGVASTHNFLKESILVHHVLTPRNFLRLLILVHCILMPHFDVFYSFNLVLTHLFIIIYRVELRMERPVFKEEINIDLLTFLKRGSRV